jgi:hypothetical protein
MGARQRAVHGDNADGGLDSHMALNALESVSDDLDTMTADERRQFVAVVERMAATEDPATAAWIREMPRNAGLEIEP